VHEIVSYTTKSHRYTYFICVLHQQHCYILMVYSVLIYMPLLCETKVIIVDHDALESKLIAIICPLDSTSPSHSEQTNCDEDINGNGKGYFLFCIDHNVSILSCPSRLLAMKKIAQTFLFHLVLCINSIVAS